ncbi:DUF5723 family protein [Gracilimonas sp. Q87]|uniref:DUF5723 family protein n=1 Tax=Gracilimonas sp. Q87 TaxID=3384766 RepID=UPI003983FA12
MNTLQKLAVLVLLITGLLSVHASAQSRHFNAQSIGMGGGGTAYIDGFNANFVNPANLMLDTHKGRTQIGIANTGFKAGGTLANLSVYNDYLTTGLLIDDETRENMLNDWFGESSANTRQMAGTVNVSPIGVSHRRSKQAFSIATRFRFTEDLTVNKGLAELMTYGLDADKFSVPTPVDFSSSTVAFAEISFGYARKVLEIPNLLFARDVKLFAGVAPKYLYGVYAADADFQSTLQMTRGGQASPFTVNHNFSYSLNTVGQLSQQLQAFEAAYYLDSDANIEDYVDYEGDDVGDLDASGFGVDLGATLEMDVSYLPIPLFINKDKILRVSMSITDLGSISYKKTPSRIFAEGEFTYQGAQNEDSFNDYFDNLGDSLKTDVYGNFNAEETDGITHTLPGMYNFGASLEMGKLLVGLDYGFGFNNEGINSRRSVLNLGAQYRLFGFVPIRAGTTIGGYSSVAYSAGIGLDFDFLEFTVGASTVANSRNSGSSAAAAWSGLVVRF